MQLTPKLNLKKPDLTDSINVQDLNDNMDVLDTAVSELQEGSASIPDLETNDKTLAGAINEIKQTVNDVETNAKEYTDQQTAAIDTALKTHKDDITSHNYYATAVGGTVNNITATINADITSYKSGLCVTFYNSLGANANGQVTINVNGLGNRHIVKTNGSASWTPGEFPYNQYVTVRILPNNGNFLLQSESGEIGTQSYREFNTAGSYTFTVPQGVTRILAKMWGAGGGGGGAQHSDKYGGGGGGSGGFKEILLWVKPGQTLTVNVGAGGAGGNGVLTSGFTASPGSAGGTTSILGAQSQNFYAHAGGGGTGGRADGGGYGGYGGLFEATGTTGGITSGVPMPWISKSQALTIAYASTLQRSFEGGFGCYTISMWGGAGGTSPSDCAPGLSPGQSSQGGAYYESGNPALQTYAMWNGGRGGAGNGGSGSNGVSTIAAGSRAGAGGAGGNTNSTGTINGGKGADGLVILSW